eukprot:m.37622 g.37622  ORF g.37622 m.37622 type:complete len:85 (-) comp13641_c0_seq2:60-314(-)
MHACSTLFSAGSLFGWIFLLAPPFPGKVIRGIDRGLVHKWHSKACDATLSKAQKEHCIMSMMEYEGSKKQLALRLYKAENSNTR